MQVIIDEIINNVRAVEREFQLSAEQMKKIVDACVRAVENVMRNDKRSKEERSVGGPGALESDRDW